MSTLKMKAVALIIAIVGINFQQQAHAWGMTGHRVISEIAEQHLTKKAKKNIKKLIGDQKLAYWSNWADFVKSDPSPELKKTGSWHFVNSEADLSFDAFNATLQSSPDNNLYKAYIRLKEETKNNSANLTLLQKQQNLYFILHLYADAHQPMHVSRAADLGGNKIEVSFFGHKTNIHRVWDSDLVDNEKYSFMEYARVLDIYDKKHYKTYHKSFEEVLYESHELANKIYKDVEYNANLSYSYIYAYKYIMEECLLKAGIRLAQELNELYG